MNKIQYSLCSYGKNILPPSVISFIKRLSKIGKPKKTRRWSGNFSTFQEVLDLCGSDSPYDLAHKTTLSGAQVNSIQESIKCDKSTMLLLGAIANILASKYITKLRVLDFGGGPGHFFFELKKFLPTIEICWDIIDTPTIVERGNKFGVKELRFFSSISDVRFEEYDLIIASSSIQYLESPYLTLDNITLISHRYFLLTKSTEIEGDKDRLTFQEAPGIKAPYWFFSKNRLHNYLTKSYKEVMEWEDSHMPTVLDGKEISMRGYLFKKL